MPIDEAETVPNTRETKHVLAMLLGQLVTTMADWRPLRGIPRKVRNVGLALVIGATVQYVRDGLRQARTQGST